MKLQKLFPITKIRLFKYTENFNSKNWKFSDKRNPDIFLISAQNIDCGCSLAGSNEYPQPMFLKKTVLLYKSGV